MRSFDTFQKSIERLQSKIQDAQSFEISEMTQRQWSVLREIFRGIDVMASGTSLVGNSKVMHHMVPNIVPPIDREYTLRYLRGNTNITNDLDFEWNLMKEIISEFFISVVSDKKFKVKSTEWMARSADYPWDTSIMKIVDNLIIGQRNI
jgi:hypothetical protein